MKSHWPLHRNITIKHTINRVTMRLCAINSPDNCSFVMVNMVSLSNDVSAERKNSFVISTRNNTKLIQYVFGHVSFRIWLYIEIPAYAHREQGFTFPCALVCTAFSCQISFLIRFHHTHSSHIISTCWAHFFCPCLYNGCSLFP